MSKKPLLPKKPMRARPAPIYTNRIREQITEYWEDVLDSLVVEPDALISHHVLDTCLIAAHKLIKKTRRQYDTHKEQLQAQEDVLLEIQSTMETALSIYSALKAKGEQSAELIDINHTVQWRDQWIARKELEDDSNIQINR